MPPHEAYRANLSLRYPESEGSFFSCPINMPLLVALGVFIVLFVYGLYMAVLYRGKLAKACSDNREILNSLILTKQDLAKAMGLQETQRRDIMRLHKIGVFENGPLPSTMSEQVAAEIEQVQGYQEWELEGKSQLEDEEVFVVGSGEEEDDETRIRDSVVTNASTVETDPDAPRIATTGVVRTAVRLSGEAARPRRADRRNSF
ncbi:hypothetical protein LZ30DRAFT_783292 [Colletotrichum cereale]|nr:hypothetical protein LZ30DRAFT_783292 [Colletotrichum cereale]